MFEKPNGASISSPRVDDLTMIACGGISRFVVEKLLGPNASLEALLVFGQSLGLALRSLVRDDPEGRNDDLVNSARLTLSTLKTQDEASWQDLALEEIAVIMASSVQTIWRRSCSDNFFGPNYDYHYLHLPLVFQKWETACQYLEPVRQIFTKLGFNVPTKDLQSAFYIHVAQELYRFNVYDAQDAIQMIRLVAFADAQYNGLNAQQRMFFLLDPTACRRLSHQFEQFGFSTMKKMQAFAGAFTASTLGESRTELAETLDRIIQAS